MEQATKDNLKKRFGASIVLLVLAFIGIIITDFIPRWSLTYWSIMLPIFALICLWLSWIDDPDKRKFKGITLWHEFLHWLATLAAVYVAAMLVHTGLISNIIAGLFVLMLLALGTFIAGIYIDTTFMLIGAVLGIFALVAAFFIKYLFIVTIPLIIIAVIVLIYFYFRRKK